MMFKAKQSGDEGFDSPPSRWLSGPSPCSGTGTLQKFPEITHFTNFMPALRLHVLTMTLPRNSLWGTDPQLQLVTCSLGVVPVNPGTSKFLLVKSTSSFQEEMAKTCTPSCVCLCVSVLNQASAHLEGNLSISFQPCSHPALGGRLLKVFSGKKLSNDFAMGGRVIAPLPRHWPFT